MFSLPQIDEQSETPIYRQLFQYLRDSIATGKIPAGSRLPATRELAGTLGLNRTTISAAYELLESEGLIAGQVGRGSFVTGPIAAPGDFSRGLDWRSLLTPGPAAVPAQATAALISFASSRPSELLFPVEEFRRSCEEVIAKADVAGILQLGSPGGYQPLRRYLIAEATRQGTMGPGDDLIITSGVQQALDLLQRALIRPGDKVAVEDPVYPGVKNLLIEAGAQVIGVRMTSDGIDLGALERILERDRPKLLIITPNFQNPTGATLPQEARREVLRMVRASGAVLIENDTYGDLRYRGQPLAAIKCEDTILLRSFSKIAFPGLRVGWAIGPQAVIARMIEAKQLSDLHSDQLSQAVLLRFAESGRLEAHRRQVLQTGDERLSAVLEACEEKLPAGSTHTSPEGGMNLWVRLPAPLDAGELLPRAQREKINYLPGYYFTVSRPDPGGLRLSFAGLAPAQIREGVSILGGVCAAELERTQSSRGRQITAEPAPALV